MVAQLQDPVTTMTRADVIDRVQRKIEGGMQPNAAFSQVYDEIEAEGRLLDLARLHGSALVGTLWRSWNITNRPAAVSRTGARPIHPAPLASIPRPAPSAPPARVVDPALLQDRPLLDTLYKLDGEWVRLGDMDRVLCHKAFKQYRSAAMADEHNAQYFRALEAALADGGKVEDTFDDAKLLLLFKRTKPASQQVPVP